MRVEALWKSAPKRVMTTGIGSLPHACVDSALAFAFGHSLPFLPQIPIRYPKEFMVAQALENLPGVDFEADGCGALDESAWQAGRGALEARTEKAFHNAHSRDAFAEFEPSRDVWSCWIPFLWELEERKVPFAKIQLAGPMTCQWALRLTDGSPADRKPEISNQVFRLVLATAIAMSRKLQSLGVTPLFYLDEPGFYGFSLKNPRHLLALQELRLFVQSLKNENVLVGLHCCSNTDWEALLSLPIDVLSLDTHLSLVALLSRHEAVRKFLARGARFSFGVIPTGTHSLKIHSLRPQFLFDNLLETLHKGLADEPRLVREVLRRALFTPACGLALHSVEDAEAILQHLLEVGQLSEQYVLS